MPKSKAITKKVAKKVKASTRKASKGKANTITIKSQKDIVKYNKATKGKILLGIIVAEWCGACKRLEPELNQSLNTPTNHSRMIIDSEVAKKIPELNSAVTKYPSFIVIKNGVPMDQTGPEGITKEVQNSPRTAHEIIELANNPSRVTPSLGTPVTPSLGTPVNRKKNNRNPTNTPRNASIVESVKVKEENTPLSMESLSREVTSEPPKPEEEVSKTFTPKYITK
jgi:thiol-disulfide isomerase/thioredoxin